MKNINLKNEKPNNDIHYYRVSSDEQTKNFSLDNQTKSCTEFSQRSGYTVFQAFREEGESAKTADRTELQRMMKFAVAHKKQIARLVIFKVDRLSRKTEDYLAIKAFFKALGISIVSVTEKLEDTSTGKFLETLLSAVAELDNNARSERTVAGMKARLLKGLWCGVAPWGYTNFTEKITGSKSIIPHPERASIVKMLFENFVTGKYSFRELAVMANAMGQKSRTGRKITKQFVAQIIRNPIYCGRIVVPKFGIDTKGIHQPLISEKLFDEANGEGNGATNRKLPRNKDNQDFPLRGLIQCEGCGGNITGGKTKGHTKYYQYYNCHDHECAKRTSIKKDSLEKDFTIFLSELTPNDELFEILKEAIKIAHELELQSVTTSGRKLGARIVELKDKKDKLLDLKIREQISDDEFASANEKVKLLIAELENELASLTVPELGLDNMIESGIDFLKHLPENWRGLAVKDLKVLRSLLFPQNVIYTYPGIKTHEVCCIYNMKTQNTSDLNAQVLPVGIEPTSRA